jgi:bifunctional DNase/RNase
MPLAKVDFFDLRYDHKNDSPVLFLKDAERDKFLPVWIGALEANSIELAVMHKRAPRPLTHDLFSHLLERTGVQLVRAVIDKLEARTYFATLHFEQDGEPVIIDCRPSDAIAIALRENVRIYVDDGLMYNIKFVELHEADAEGEDGMGLDVDDDGYREEEQERLNEDVFQDFLRNISPGDFREG